MGKSSDSFLNTAIHRRNISRWAYTARSARKTDLTALRKQSKRALELRTHLDELIHVADERLSYPEELSLPPAPHNADWSWRPDLWSGLRSRCKHVAAISQTKLDDDVTLFHDCPRCELSLRQLRNHDVSHRAPYGMCFEVFHFEGSFLSIVLDLPEDGSAGLTRRHILKVNMLAEMERQVEVFVRLNLVYGPNTEQLVRELDVSTQDLFVEFDLASAKVNEKRITKSWIDVIFENPQMNQVVLRDMVLSRRPRSQV